ncbi:MAG: hypothetical protein JNJ54_01760 [Myxococcaceae bacterium]|nr:hypothetical protein [Myxococcaceae bacterium]
MRPLTAVALAWACVAEAGAPGMTNLNPSTRPSARTGAGMAVVETTGPDRFILFGGNSGLSANNQTWVYDVTGNAWTQMMPASSPSSRAWGSLTWDPQHQRAVLFGGSRDLNGPLLNDVHLYDPVGNSWQALTTSSDAGPSPRFLSNMVYVPAWQAHLLFAGGTATSSNAEATVLTNELWRLLVNPDAGTAAWTRLSPSGPAPPPRASACAGFDQTRGRLLVFGGEIVNDTIADLVEYDVMSDTWVSGAPVGGAAPTKRGSSVCTFDRRADKFIVYGGVSQPSGTPVSAVFTFEPATRQWSAITPMPSAGNNTFGAPVYSRQLGGMAFFGGRTSLIGTSQATWWLRVNAAPLVQPMGTASAPEGAMDLRTAPSVTDADGDPLTYLWVQISGPDAGITNAATATPTIATPRVLAMTPLGYSVLVTDGFDPPRDAGFTLLVQDSINEPPVADAGPDRLVDAGVMVLLDGRGSFDPNGEPLTFVWTQVAGPAVSLGVIPPGSQAGFTTPAGPTTLDIELTVRDPRVGTAQALVRVTVRGADGGVGGGGAGGGSAGGAAGGSAGGASGGSAGGVAGGSAGGAAGGVAGGSAGGAAGGNAGGVAGGASGGVAGGASGGVAGGASGGVAGGNAGVAGGSAGGAAGGDAGGVAGGASGGGAGGGGSAGGASGGSAGGGGASGGSAGGAGDDGGGLDAGEGDGGVDPRAGPPRSYGVGCGCDASASASLWLGLGLFSVLARRVRRR